MAWGTGWAARRGPVSALGGDGPFPRSLPPNPPGGFHRNGLSSDYAVCVTGVAWMAAWQARQATRVLRRLLAIRAPHAGWPRPGFPSLATLGARWPAPVAP